MILDCEYERPLRSCWQHLHKSDKVWNIICLGTLPNSFYLLTKFTLPNCQINIANFFIWLFCQLDFTTLSSPLCQIIKSTIPSHQFHIIKINIAKLPSIFQHVNSFNELLVAYKYKILWIVQCLIFFQSARIYAPKTQKVFFKIPRLPFPQWFFCHKFSQLGDQKIEKIGNFGYFNVNLTKKVHRILETLPNIWDHKVKRKHCAPSTLPLFL